jgi:hypothetical protein
MNNKIEMDFYEGNRSEELPFVINDSVEILEGSDKGKTASVISILNNKTELSYLIEKSDGTGDISISATSIKLI